MAKGIFKRKKSLYYWICYKGLSGKIVRESTKTDKFREAEAILHGKRQHVREGNSTEIKRIKNITFTELSVKYLEWAQRLKSFESRKRQVNQLVRDFGHLPLRNFNTLLLEQYQTERKQKGNKPATCNRAIACIKHMLVKAVDWSLLEEPIQKNIQKKVKLLKENNKRDRFLTIEEIDRLLKCCSPHLRPIVIFALNTGCRKGEILNLKWENIDFQTGFISLSEDETKNSEVKKIPINNATRSTLKEMVRHLSSPYVFVNAKGEKYADIKTSWETALRKSKITKYTFHDNRHTFASHLVMSGVDLMVVSKLLGHKSLLMTLRYSHLSPNHQSKAVNVLDAVYNQKTPPESISTSHLLHTLAKNDEKTEENQEPLRAITA